MQADGRSFGLVVDGISDSKDIVVKPLGKHFTGLTAFSGATILGDGKVALILDVIGISECANFVAEGRDRAASEAVVAHEAGAERQTLLICRYGDHERVAIPLGQVARLEAFPLTSVEKSSSHEVVQYRGEIMPLLHLGQILGASANAEEAKETIQVVVHRDRGRTIGLVVEQIADIVEEFVRVKNDNSGGYFSGTAVVQEKVTDILDVHGVIESALPGYLDQADAA